MINKTKVSLNFQLSGRIMDYIPEEIELRLPIFPNVSSNFGSIISGYVGGYTFSPGLPMTYTKYPVPIAMGWWQWSMISALQFINTDLQIEIVGTYIIDVWLCSSYVYYQG